MISSSPRCGDLMIISFATLSKVREITSFKASVRAIRLLIESLREGIGSAMVEVANAARRIVLKSIFDSFRFVMYRCIVMYWMDILTRLNEFDWMERMWYNDVKTGCENRKGK